MLLWPLHLGQSASAVALLTHLYLRLTTLYPQNLPERIEFSPCARERSRSTGRISSLPGFAPCGATHGSHLRESPTYLLWRKSLPNIVAPRHLDCWQLIGLAVFAYACYVLLQ